MRVAAEATSQSWTEEQVGKCTNIRQDPIDYRGLSDEMSVSTSHCSVLLWDLSGSPVVKTLLPMQGAWVRSLVRELRSHTLQGTANK